MSDEETLNVDDQNLNKSDQNKSSSDEDYTDNCQIVVDNSQKILKVIKQVWEDQTMCDIYLKVGAQEYGAHRFILCASSDVFQAMLMNSAWTEWREISVELQELPLCEPVFRQFLEYFYTGKIHITHTDVMPILALADKYLVKTLSRICVSYMSQHVPHAASHNQLSAWLHYSNACGHSEIFTTCQNYLKWNFETVANTSDFCNIDCETLVGILQQNDVVVHNEMMLFHCITRWLDLQKIKIAQNQISDDFNELVENVMKYIRFPMMTPRQLADLLMSPIIKTHKDFFVDRMALGMKYHTGYTDVIEMYNELEKHIFTPRLYTSDRCSALLSVENFWSLPSYHTSTFVFSSHLSPAEHDANKVCEWVVDLYPKGAHFNKCLLISWQGTLQVPEEIMKTVRLSLTCRESPEPNIKVQISILIYGIQGGIEHVIDVKKMIHYFTKDEKVLNIDDLIPFHELNPAAALQREHNTAYLTGSNRDQLKLNIIITHVK